MKILLSTFPAWGHVNPFQPVARELVRRGHTVAWLTGQRFKAAVEVTGATFIPFTAELDPVMEGPMQPADPSQGGGLGAAIDTITKMFIAPVGPMVAQYKEICQTLNPDLIVNDLCGVPAYVFHELGGPIYATISVIPLHTMDPEIPPWGSSAFPATTFWGKAYNTFLHWVGTLLVQRYVNDALNVERKKLGLEKPLGVEGWPKNMASKKLYILNSTPIFEFPRESFKHRKEIKFVGPLLPIVTRKWDEPDWWPEVTGKTKKVVHVTQGTVATEAANLIKPTIQALKDENDILLVIATHDAETLRTQIEVPANVRLSAFIPHERLLPYVDVMVTNGGMGGVTMALVNGVPLVGAGLTEDKSMVNSRIAWSGCGIDLQTSTPSVKQIKEAVLNVLSDPKYAAGARRIKEDFATHDGPKEAADLLEELVASNG